MSVKGSCHCGQIAFTVEGEIGQVLECNCSHCSRKGYLLWFVPRANLQITKGVGSTSTYMFNKHVIRHQFCPTCGCAPFGLGKDPKGNEMAAINVRCVEDIDLDGLDRKKFDGRAL
jgi:hypothetical protein